MLLYVTDAALLVAEPLRRVVSAQLLDERRGRSGDVSGELDGVDALEDDVVRLHRVRPGKRRRA